MSRLWHTNQTLHRSVSVYKTTHATKTVNQVLNCVSDFLPYLLSKYLFTTHVALLKRNLIENINLTGLHPHLLELKFNLFEIFIKFI